ncbi:retrotransposon protein, putative, ty1-copia subclass, partial [Tanacetum coccineum]
MMIKGGKIQKANKKSLNAKGKNKVKGKGKDKKDYIPKPKNPKPTAMERPAKDDACHHCKEVGHWKRNCPVYLAELQKKRKQVGSASSSGIFTIELFAFPNKSWVYDTGCGTHVCITKQGFREARKLKQGALYLYVGNGVRAQVEAIGSYDLVLPNGLVICLDNCHYAPSITRGVVSVHRLVENGFVQCFTDFGISVSKNNVHYFNAIPSNGIYEIDMHDLVPNVNSIYNVSTKRAKHNLDSTYLWHCRLAHISKKRIEKLQQEGLLKSTDDESFDQCVSCLSGKMTRKSFPHRPERATDLLGIIHTDVCGPLRHVSRQGASYFITFTDDYIRYGYVYLLKHKHEVFETFKVFKNELENQLGKTIKALRSDRGGEYISQEFKDYLKACGIVQQLTPPYTPQHNSVFEKRNRTLLDMSATHILNMVPTKKVDKTPYELWYAEFFEEKSHNLRKVSGIGPWNLKNSSRRYITSEITSEFFWRLIRTFIWYNLKVLLILISRKVARFKGSNYGLKQASRSWNKRFDEEIKRFGFDQNLDDPCVYQKSSGGNVTFLILYVDDIIIIGNRIPSLQSVKDYHRKCFAMKDLVEAAFILGIKIYRDRPDVGFAKNITSRFQQNPGELHWTAAKNILKYLRDTKDMFLVYGGNLEAKLRVDCYCDARFETDRDDTKSQTEYVFILNGGVVDWKSSKQSTTAMSATEAEYIAALKAVWISDSLFQGCEYPSKRRWETLLAHQVKRSIKGGDDPISCLNKAMAFLTVVASSRFPSTNNQLRTSSNPRNQATIQNGRVTVQQPKRPRNAAWYKEKAMLAEAQEAGQILDEEQLAFRADPGVLDGQAVQTIIPNNVAFQTEDLDTYDSDCDDISNAQAVL